MLRPLILASSLLLLGTACTTKVEGLYVSDAFTPSQIKSGSIISGGVIDGKTPLSRSDANAYAGVLLAKIKDERPYAPVKPVENMINAVGEDDYALLLEKYSRSGLDAQTLADLEKKLPGIQFVALAKIEANTTSKSSSETQPSESKDEKGNVTKTPGSITQTHARTIDVSLNIYDLRNKNSAFSGQVSKSVAAHQSYEINGLNTIISLVNTVKGKGDDATFPYPDAPDSRAVLGEIFEGFAENFPEE